MSNIEEWLANLTKNNNGLISEANGILNNQANANRTWLGQQQQIANDTSKVTSSMLNDSLNRSMGFDRYQFEKDNTKEFIKETKKLSEQQMDIDKKNWDYKIDYDKQVLKALNGVKGATNVYNIPGIKNDPITADSNKSFFANLINKDFIKALGINDVTDDKYKHINNNKINKFNESNVKPYTDYIYNKYANTNSTFNRTTPIPFTDKNITQLVFNLLGDGATNDDIKESMIKIGKNINTGDKDKDIKIRSSIAKQYDIYNEYISDPNYQHTRLNTSQINDGFLDTKSLYEVMTTGKYPVKKATVDIMQPDVVPTVKSGNWITNLFKSYSNFGISDK